MGGSYYERVTNNLFPGHDAEAEDINHIQANVEDALRDLINDLHDGKSYILGEDKDSFLLSPAPKRGNLYIDTQNITSRNKFKFLTLKNTGYKQKIRKTKTSLYSINIFLRNRYHKPVTVWFELRNPNENNLIIAKQSIKIPPHTDMEEFEVVFAQNYIPTAVGVNSLYAENDPDSVILNGRINNDLPTNIASMDGSLGIDEYDFIIKPLNMGLDDLAPESGDENIIIDEDTFGVFVDSTGGYGEKLYLTKNGGLEYQNTKFDLVFKDIYSSAPTYLCTGGDAVIDGHKVFPITTHIEIQGGSAFGNVVSLVYLDLDGYYRVANSDAFLNTEKPNFPTIEDKILPIAFITTYPNSKKPPKIEQEDINQITRPRSMYERIRRLEKQVRYDNDLNVPPRIKYTLSKDDLIDNDSDACTCNNITFPSTEDGNYLLTTDSKGNLAYRATKADVFDIPITFKEVSNNTGLNAAKNITKNHNMNIDTENGIVTLATYVTKEAQEAIKNVLSSDEEYSTTIDNLSLGNKSVIEKTMKLLEQLDLWAKVNEPNTDEKPKERVFTTYAGVDKLWQKKTPEYPAMTLYIEKTTIIKELTIPVTKFKDMKNFKIAIFKRQHKNIPDNTVWLHLPVIFESEYVSLENAPKEGGYQVLRKPHTFKLGDDGIKFEQNQYVIVIFGKPVNKEGSIITSTIPTLKKRDFLIRYRGTTSASRFRIRGRAFETWSERASADVDLLDYHKNGYIESGIVNFADTNQFDIAVPNISSILPNGSITTPEGCSYQLWVKTNQTSWTKAALGESLDIKGTQFQWKLEFNGTDESTPTIDISKSDTGYGLHFSITMDPLSSYAGGAFNDTGDCLTTNTIKAEDILKTYIGDPSFNPTGYFSRYEFVRLWGQENAGKIVCDIHASNKTDNISLIMDNNPYGTGDTCVGQCITKTADNKYKFEKTIDVFSLIYADLELEDFTYPSVDYSNYDPQTEYDEYNFRLKLDNDTAYNDEDVGLFSKQDWTIIPDKNPDNNIANINGNISIGTGNINNITTTANTILAKISINNFVDLTKYSALVFNYKLTGDALEGLGLYISLTNEIDGPTFDSIGVGDTFNGKEIIRENNLIPPNLNMSTEEQVEYYYNKILEILVERNNVTYKVYYEYYIDANGIYQYRMVHDLRSYIFYKLPTLQPTIQDSIIYIPLDKDNDWFKYVKEIGLVAITNEGDTPQLNAGDGCVLELKNLDGQILGYNKLFDGNDHEKWIIPDIIAPHIEKTNYNDCVKLELSINTPAKINALNNNQLMYINNDTFTQDFNHLGIQLASSHYIHKGMFKLNFHDQKNGKGNIIYTLDIPSLNYIQNPLSNENVKFTQIYKKINEDNLVRSLSITTGPMFANKLNEIIGSTGTKELVLYINDIMLYEAKTMPILYKNLRAKIYSKSEGSYNLPTIRKFGAVLTYR